MDSPYGSSLGVPACVGCWKECRLAIGVSLHKDLPKVRRRGVGSLN